MTMAPPSGADDEAVHPFRLQVPQVQLDDLVVNGVNSSGVTGCRGRGWRRSRGLLRGCLR